MKKTGKILLSSMIMGVLYLNPLYALADNDFNLKIIHTNDIHGRLNPIDYSPEQKSVGGTARRAELIKEIKKQNKNVLVLDAGDVAQGTLFYKIYHGVPDMKIMSKIGYDAFTLGNHEFDSGISILEKMISHAKFPVLSSNLKFTKNKNMAKIVKPYTIKKYGDYKVGIIGVTTSQLKTLSSVNNGLLVYDDITSVQSIINQIKNKVDFIVVLSHVGIDEDIELAKAVPDIDVIVGGHSHTFLAKPIVINHKNHQTLIVQNGEFGINLGALDLTINNGEVSKYNYKVMPVNSSVKNNPKIAKFINKLSKKVDIMNKTIIGQLETSAEAGEYHSGYELTTAGVLITQSIQSKFTDADIIMQNSGGIRKSLSAGDVSLADLYEFMPFDNKVYLTEISGKDLKSILETSSHTLPQGSSSFLQTQGVEYTVDLSKNPQILSKDKTKILKEGNRISNIKINGIPIDMDKYYKVALSDFIFYGGDGYPQFANGKNTVKTNFSFQNLLTEYIKNNSPVCLKIKDEINIYQFK